MSHAIISIIIFVVAFIVIMTEKIHRAVVAVSGAVLLLIIGILDLESAASYIDVNTIGVLVGMMLFVAVVKESGIFEYIAIKSAKIAKGDPMRIMVSFVVITAVMSAFLDNVTTVLLIAPMTFAIAKNLEMSPVPFFMTQILASNIGGTATLIGDPPNIMIGSQAGLSFMDFVLNDGPAVVVVLIVTIIAFRFIYRKDMVATEDAKRHVMALNESEAVKNHSLLRKSVIMTCLVIVGFMIHGYLGVEPCVVALVAACIMIIIGKQDVEKTIAGVEWSTIIFFIGLFIVVGGMVQTGVIDDLAKYLIQITGGNPVAAMLIILWFSAILSAILDNIPFVATMIPLIHAMGVSGMDIWPLWWALSLGACLGGNGTLIGASANVVLSGISTRQGYPITFKSFTKIGFPMMIMSMIIVTGYMLLRYT